MVFINLSKKEEREKTLPILVLAGFSLIVSCFLYFSPESELSLSPKVDVEEVELVHVLLDQIEIQSPELKDQVKTFRIRFGENSALLGTAFFRMDAEGQYELLTKKLKNLPDKNDNPEIVAKSR